MAQVSGHDVSQIERNADLVRVFGLDSLAGLRLLAAVEKNFDVRFPDDQLGNIRTLDQILDIIEPREAPKR